MNKLEKDGILQQIQAMEDESNLDAVKELIQYLKKDVESC